MAIDAIVRVDEECSQAVCVGYAHYAEGVATQLRRGARDCQSAPLLLPCLSDL
jgi:hypothetical protein